MEERVRRMWARVRKNGVLGRCGSARRCEGWGKVCKEWGRSVANGGEGVKEWGAEEK